MTTYLTRSELAERTGYKQRPSQLAALQRLGIAFAFDGRGRILVLRDAAIGKQQRVPREPNWDAIKAA